MTMNYFLIRTVNLQLALNCTVVSFGIRICDRFILGGTIPEALGSLHQQQDELNTQ